MPRTTRTVSNSVLPQCLAMRTLLCVHAVLWQCIRSAAVLALHRTLMVIVAVLCNRDFLGDRYRLVKQQHVYMSTCGQLGVMCPFCYQTHVAAVYIRHLKSHCT